MQTIFVVENSFYGLHCPLKRVMTRAATAPYPALGALDEAILLRGSKDGGPMTIGEHPSEAKGRSYKAPKDRRGKEVN
jgi:hypothetical protein